jgi:hypothetical protein
MLRRVADLLVRIGLPVGALAVVIAVFLGERLSVDHELSLMVPAGVVPGTTLPVRAFVFEQIDPDGGGRIGEGDVEVSLVDADGDVIARQALRRSRAGGSEGAILVPRDVSGSIRVRAIARVGGEPVASVETEVDTEGHYDSPIVPRRAGALSQLALGAIETLGSAPPPSVLDVRVGGGACVPEARCEIIVHVGEPAAAIDLSPTGAVTLEDRDARETSGLVVLHALVHGPEAHTALVATRGGVPVAQRAITLPVALATPHLSIDRSAGHARPRMLVEVLGDRPGIVVDAYLGETWMHTGSIGSAARETALPFALDGAVWRLQVHTDPFSSERSAVRKIVVSPGVTANFELVAGSAPEGPLDARLAWVSAPEEEGYIPLPRAVSGYADDVRRLEARQRALRTAAIIALVLGVAVAAILFLRRGVSAAQEAQRVMEATGDPELASARHRRRTLLSALLVVATLLLAFVGAAALIAARAHLFE